MPIRSWSTRTISLSFLTKRLFIAKAGWPRSRLAVLADPERLVDGLENLGILLQDLSILLQDLGILLGDFGQFSELFRLAFLDLHELAAVMANHGQGFADPVLPLGGSFPVFSGLLAVFSSLFSGPLEEFCCLLSLPGEDGFIPGHLLQDQTHSLGQVPGVVRIKGHDEQNTDATSRIQDPGPAPSRGHFAARSTRTISLSFLAKTLFIAKAGWDQIVIRLFTSRVGSTSFARLRSL